jgi:hypothetical protein
VKALIRDRDTVLGTHSTEIRFRVIAQSTWKKSTAGMVEACARRNRRHDVPVARSGAGSDTWF